MREYKRDTGAVQSLSTHKVRESGSAGGGIKRQEKFHGPVGIEEPEFLPWLPELRMEPYPFRGIKTDFGFVEKHFEAYVNSFKKIY